MLFASWLSVVVERGSSIWYCISCLVALTPPILLFWKLFSFN